MCTGILVRDLFLNPAVESTLDSKAIAAAHATKARLVLVASPRAIVTSTAMHAAWAGATVLEAGAEGGQAHCTAVLAARWSQQASDGRSSGTLVLGTIAIRDTGRLTVPRDWSVRDLEVHFAGRRRRCSKEHGLLSGKSLLLMVLLLLSLVGDLAQI